MAVFEALAAAVPAPAPPKGYGRPSTLLEAAVKNRRYARQLIGHDPSLKSVIEGIIEPDLAHERRIAAFREEVISAQERVIASLESELAAARAGWHDAEKRLYEEKLRPSSRDAIGRVLIAAIAKAYGAQVLKGETPIAESLARSAMDNLGITLDPKTVRKYVNAAIAQYRAYRAA